MTEPTWKKICSRDDLVANSGVAALLNDQQIAIYYIPQHQKQIFAISNYDPIGKAQVLSRGIIGDLEGEMVVASPLYKQHFRLTDGQCIEKANYRVKTFDCTMEGDSVLIKDESRVLESMQATA